MKKKIKKFLYLLEKKIFFSNKKISYACAKKLISSIEKSFYTFPEKLTTFAKSFISAVFLIQPRGFYTSKT